ncbi:MAG TPA: DUF3078 domain-containing protein [Flavobacterium sp.]|nr:DUF3078 domain-containing protein [Flavobacterium sp.]
MRKLIFAFLFSIVLIPQKIFAQQDSITINYQDRVKDVYYNDFKLFDTIRSVNDTLYLAPILVEQKVILHDSTSVALQAKGYRKVTLSSYEVTKRSTGNNISYFMIEPETEMFYNRKPTTNYLIPYQAYSSLVDDFSYWTKVNIIGLDISQGSFSNWNAGGYNSVSGVVKGEFARKYEKGRIIWNNELKVQYGMYKQENQEWRKTDDVLQLNSTIGYRTSVKSNWLYTSKFTFNTQMADGFTYPDIDNPISRPFAPAYVFLGIGAEYAKPNTGLLIYFSPATWKATYVMDETLANRGEFGVEAAVYDENGVMIRKGKNARHEFGFLITNEYNKELLKNVTLEHKLKLYTDYLNNFGNIDIDWELKLKMRVNQFINATLGTHMIYDDDIQNKRDVDGVQINEGPKIQFKQQLGIGVEINF